MDLSSDSEDGIRVSGDGGGSGGAGEDERELADCLFGFGDWERVVVRILLNQDGPPSAPPAELM